MDNLATREVKNPSGLCECGCGETTSLMRGDNARRLGYVEGSSARFISGHNSVAFPCGTAAKYQRGCRCDECRAAACLKARKTKLKITYGISEEQFDEMLHRQGGGCAICGTTRDRLKTHLAVDHDHVTGAIRGVLCSQCNRALGLFKDSSELLQAALDYLKETA